MPPRDAQRSTPRSESETRCPICEQVIREDDLYEDGCPFCGTWIEEAGDGE